jgi:hypothetical protein
VCSKKIEKSLQKTQRSKKMEETQENPVNKNNFHSPLNFAIMVSSVMSSLPSLPEREGGVGGVNISYNFLHEGPISRAAMAA